MMLIVSRTTVHLESCRMGGYDLSVLSNVQGSANPLWQEKYHQLLWTEAVDIVLEELDGRRPGYALDEGRRWSIPPLFDWGGPSI